MEGIESISGDIVRVTDKAILLAVNSKNVWIPKSVIDDYDCDDLEGPHDDVDLLIQAWFYKQHEAEFG